MMTVDVLLHVLGSSLLGGAVTYVVWARLSSRSARNRPDKRDPAGDEGTGTRAETADRPSGATVELVSRTREHQQDIAMLEALRADVGDLAQSVLTLHDLILPSGGDPSDEASDDPTLSDIAAAVAGLPEHLAQRLEANTPESLDTDRLAKQLSDLLAAQRAEAAPEADRLAALEMRVEQMGTAVTQALAAIPGDIQAALTAAGTRSDSGQADALEDRLEYHLAAQTTRQAEQLTELEARILAALSTPAAEEGPQEALSRIEARIDGLQQYLTETAARPAAELAAISARLEAFATAQAESPPETAALAENLAALTDRVAALKDGGATQLSLEPLKERLGLFGTALAGVGHKLQGIETGLADLRGPRDQDDQAALAERLAAEVAPHFLMLQTAVTEELRDILMTLSAARPVAGDGADTGIATAMPTAVPSPSAPAPQPQPELESDGDAAFSLMLDALQGKA